MEGGNNFMKIISRSFAIAKLQAVALATALILALAGCPDNDQNGKEENDDSRGPAFELVEKIRVGWNLGNTLDFGGSYNAATSVGTMETGWVKTKTTQALIDALHSGGFNAIRIPVTWGKAADPGNNYKIRDDWMARVKEIVDYAVKNNMYIILNTHHDTSLFKLTDADYEASLVIFAQIWEQIAAAFKDYDEKLIFEGLNEPRTIGTPNEWNGGTAPERANLNKYYQKFVDVVRASGGNNGTRFLLLNTYSGSRVPMAMVGLKMPADTVENRLIAGYHAYVPHSFAMSTSNTANKWDETKSADTAEITEPINDAYDTFIKKGIPVIIGEFGAMNKDNAATRAKWAEYYVKQAKEKGIPCFWWDNGVTTGTGERFGLIDRASNQFHYPEIVTALMKGTE
jgi:endoglucanase